MQIQVVESYAEEERYTIHPDKTKIIKLGASTRKQELLLVVGISDHFIIDYWGHFNE